MPGTDLYKYESAGNLDIMTDGYANLEDTLLRPICLELGVMVGIYFKTHRHLVTRVSLLPSSVAAWQSAGWPASFCFPVLRLPAAVSYAPAG